jgi:hypothetical protein
VTISPTTYIFKTPKNAELEANFESVEKIAKNVPKKV